MASEYFGLRGNLVKRYQELLNSLGADLKVNGRWNKKTEAAFNQYRDQFLEALGLKVGEENPYKRMEVETQSEEAMRQAAENRYGASYDAELEGLNRSARDTKQALEAEMGALEPSYQNQLNQLKGQYDEQRQALSDAALSRGLGRSSYVTDQLAGSHLRENADASALSAQKESKREALKSAIFEAGTDRTDSAARILREREQKILSAIDQYRAEGKKARDDALKYNNEIDEKFRKEQEQKRQFQQEFLQRLRLERMKRR